MSDSLIALEPRFMFDAAGVATGAEVAAETVALEQAEQALDNAPVDPIPPAVVESTEKVLEALSLVDVPDNDRTEIIFIDTAVENYESLLEGLDSNAEVIFLDSDSDGVEQIAQVLADRDDVDAIHIIAHGDAGQLQLGNTLLTEQSMQGEHADELALINSALSENADILIYGCNFAEGEIGQSATEALAQLTGADIAASDDVTGAAELGGDWDLETQVGSIETDIFVEQSAMDKWAGKLAIAIDNTASSAEMAAEMEASGDGLTFINLDKHSPPGDDQANGTFSGGDTTGLGIDSGVIFTTGRTGNILGDGDLDPTDSLLSTNNTKVINASVDNAVTDSDLIITLSDGKTITIGPEQGLLSILSDKKLEIELIVPSTWLTWLKRKVDFEFLVDETGKKYKAEVAQLGASVDPVSQTIRVKGAFTSDTSEILSGMSGTARFRQPDK